MPRIEYESSSVSWTGLDEFEGVLSNYGEPRPCPFCGSTHLFLHSERSTSFPDGYVHHTFSCMGCGAKARNGVYVKDALDNWNRRAGDGERGASYVGS